MSCCCCVTPTGQLLEGIRKQEQLVREEEEEEEEQEEEEEDRRNMDVSLLREQYRSSRERQRRQTQVLLFRKVSEELSEAVSIIPVTQGLALPPLLPPPPPAVTFDPDPTTYDPLHVHLGLHRRSCPGVAAPLSASSSRRSSSSEAGKLCVEPTSGSLSSCSSFNGTKEEDDEEEEDDHFSAQGSGADPGSGSTERPRADSKVSATGSLEQSASPSPGDSQERLAPGSLTSSGESSAPVASITCSPANPLEDLAGSRPAAVTTSSAPAWRGSRFTRQLSVGGVGSSSGVHQNQNHYPFPNRKTPRISEAARRLGMYSSF